MNDVFVLACCFLVSCGLILMAILYNTYRGVHDTLANATCGTVYNFRYFQPLTGDYDRYLAKVTNVRKLDAFELGSLNFTSNYRRGDKNFKRSPTLVTCQMSNGDYRQFYAERSDMCKRSAIGGLLFKAGVAHLF
jgi:hypothetical protein